MKKALIIFAMLAMVVSGVIAGELRTTPQYLVLSQPTTNQVELISQKYFYGPNARLEIVYNVVDSNGSVVSTEMVTVSGGDFTTFVDGIISTMRSRGDAAVWTDIQSKYDTQADP